jgi:hypothetical protein
MRSDKCDYRLQVGYGSSWHMLRCLGWHRQQFTRQIANEIGAETIHWLDFSSEAGGKTYPSGVPLRDSERRRIDFVSDRALQVKYDEFWPTRGEQQNWDAVGQATIGGHEEWVLVEAKAHSAEIRRDGTHALENGGRPKIRAAFRETVEALGYVGEAAAAQAEAWLTGYYQHANRLATLHFFTKHGINARLVFIYFCGDRHPDAKSCPPDPDGWTGTLATIESSLGLTGKSALEQRVHSVFLNVNLAGAQGDG